MTSPASASQLHRERLYPVVDRDFDPPMVVLMAADSVYGPHVATMEYNGHGSYDLDGGACADVDEATEIAQEIAHRWHVHAGLTTSLRALAACNWLDSDPSDSPELATAKKAARSALAASEKPA